MEVALDVSLRRSFSSEDDTESVYSVQAKETDVVQDTDSESYDDFSSTTLELEYEVASTSDSEDEATKAKCEVLLGTGVDGVSSSGEEDINVTAAIAAVLCDSSLEAWATDGEDSDTTAYNDSVSSAASASGRGTAGFSTCLQCNGRNDQPKVQYCDKCFQARKNLFPPRPRGARKRKLERQAAEEAAAHLPSRKRRTSSTSCDEPPVKLTALQNCLSGLSQDSGLGSSQDLQIPSFNFDKIILPKVQQKRKRLTSGSVDFDVDTSNSCVSDADVKPTKLPRLDHDANYPPSTSKTVLVHSAIVDRTNAASLREFDVATSSGISTDSNPESSKNTANLPEFDIPATSKLKLTNTSNVALVSSSKTAAIASSTEISPCLESKTVAKVEEFDIDTSSKLNLNSVASCSKMSPYLEPGSSKTVANMEEFNVATSPKLKLNDAAVASYSKMSSYLRRGTSKRSASLEELSTIKERGECDVATSDDKISNLKIAQSTSDSSMGPLPELAEMCILCNVRPKNGIFLHGKIAHLCCCYKCAMKTWRINRRCPVCKCKVKNVVKVFTA